AGEEIINIYNSGACDITIKADGSPVTRADMAANDIILNGLSKISSYPVMSEENYIEYDIRKTWKNFWLVDPLDGTKDFTARNGHFTVNIAMIEENLPVLGVIYAPAIDLICFAKKNGGTYKNNEKIYNNSKRTDLSASDSNFHSSKETVEFLNKHNIKHIIRAGSSIKFILLAEGKIDLYPRFNGSSEWDTAAGQIILNEAGCKIIDMKTGKEPLYNKKNTGNNYFIASRKDLDFL
ncbi:MAG: 3'(2'),5'-bisphosphate nucleotidase CysQ, partial [Candidatus Eremiobacterota bacterium]